MLRLERTRGRRKINCRLRSWAGEVNRKCMRENKVGTESKYWNKRYCRCKFCSHPPPQSLSPLSPGTFVGDICNRFVKAAGHMFATIVANHSGVTFWTQELQTSFIRYSLLIPTPPPAASVNTDLASGLSLASFYVGTVFGARFISNNSWNLSS